MEWYWEKQWSSGEVSTSVSVVRQRECSGLVKAGNRMAAAAKAFRGNQTSKKMFASDRTLSNTTNAAVSVIKRQRSLVSFYSLPHWFPASAACHSFHSCSHWPGH